MRLLHRRSQAVSLGVTLLIVLMLATLGLALARLSITHLHLNQRSSRELEATNLARSVVARAIQEIFDDRTFGSTRTDTSDLRIELSGDRPGAFGRLTFRAEEAALWGGDHSTNNLEGAVSVEGGGRTVPAYAIHLVGYGESGGVQRKVETVLRFTLFPQAIASSGPVASTGPLLVATLPDPDLVLETDLLPADLLSNGSGDTSVTLAADSRVTGDVQSVGKIVLDDTVEVWGEVRDEATAEDIPTLNTNDFNPATLGITAEPLNQSQLSQPTEVFQGAVAAQGDLTISGNAELDGALLYVPGNITIGGHLRGKGILCAQGDIQVGAGADFQAGQRMALISGGQVRLQGTGSASNFLQGVVYSRRGVVANQITVIGALVNDGGPGDSVNLDQARVFYDPTFDGVEITPPAGTEVLTKIDITDYSFVVTINPDTQPPQLEYFHYQGSTPGIDRAGLAQEVAGQTPVATFPVPQSLLDNTEGELPGSSGSGSPSGPFMGPGGAITPGRGMLPEIYDGIAGIDTFHLGLIEDDLPEIQQQLYPGKTIAELRVYFPETMTGSIARGFDRRDSSWVESGENTTKVTLTPSEFLRPNEHNKVVVWKEG